MPQDAPLYMSVVSVVYKFPRILKALEVLQAVILIGFSGVSFPRILKEILLGLDLLLH